MAGAFVDRTPMDWTALLTRARSPRDRVLLENLFLLDLLRRPGSLPQAAAGGRGLLLPARVVLAIAALQTACALVAVGVSLAIGDAPFYRTSQVVLAAAFAAASLLVGAATGRDRRSFFLLVTFACVASAFSPVPAGPWDVMPARLDVIFRGVFPDVFVPATLWRFAVDFPDVRRFTSFDLLARKTATAAWLLGFALFALNLAIAYGWIDSGPAMRLGRDHPGNLFWHLFALAVLTAVGAIFVRSRRAPPQERLKVARFARALAAGSAPFLLYAVVRMTVPDFNNWLLTAGPSSRLWLDALILVTLAATPILTTIAVVMDHPFGPGAIDIGRWRDRLLRATVTATVSAPFLALSLELYRLRRLAIADIVSGPGFWTLLACAAAGFVLLATRRRILGSGRPSQAASHQRRLGEAVERVRLARGGREIGAVLARELRRGVGAAAVSVLVPQRAGASVDSSHFVDQHGDLTPLPSDTVLPAMLGETSGPLDLSVDGPLLSLLPKKDRDWVLAGGVELAVPVKHRDDALAAIVLVAAKRGGGTFDRTDQWLLTTLVTAAAAAWDGESAAATGHASTDGDPTGCGEAAFECRTCGVVTDSTPLSCGCGDAELASLPRRLGARFVVERRLGAGGMGVVYLARDVALGREVVLKTLPELREGTVPRLRNEARAMAALNHECLATIYGLELWRRTPVLVVEYLPGGTLANVLRGGPMSPSAALALGMRLAGALSYMHARGVLHRDLKPGNIAFAATGTPKLLDFGLATIIGPSNGAGIPSARRRVAGGTPAYLPPEAVRGAPPDPAFDLWALSIVMLEAIAGRRAVTPLGLERALHRALAVDRAAGRQPSSPDVHALIAFFERALASSPRSRFASAPDMQSALEALMPRRGVL